MPQPSIPVLDALVVIKKRLEHYLGLGTDEDEFNLECAMLDIMTLLILREATKEEFLQHASTLWDDIQITEGGAQ